MGAMKCPRCDKGDLSTMHTYQNPTVKIQGCICGNCGRRFTVHSSIIQEYTGVGTGAYSVFKDINNGKIRVDVKVTKEP